MDEHDERVLHAMVYHQEAAGEDSAEELFTKYTIIGRLGEGSFGRVYKAVRTETSEFFAIKKIRVHFEEDGLPGTAIREVSLLKQSDHPNIITLHEVFSTPTALYLVFEYLDMDLRMHLKTRGAFTDPLLLKSALYQCVSGIDFCHGHRILHRDLKPQNILVDVRLHRLKLADFGLARVYSILLPAYTHEVVTLWYRAPEILLGQAKYATPMDMWSLGCIFAEMSTRHPLFPGDSEIDTLFRMFRLLGTPTEEVWPGVTSLRDFKADSFPKWRDTGLVEVRERGPALDDAGLDMLRSCLQYNPVDRPSAPRLLLHPFFQTADGVLPGVA